MSEAKGPGPLPVDETGKSLDELVSLGCKFVVDGELFKTTIDLIEKLVVDGAADQAGTTFLLSLRSALLTTVIPVKENLKPASGVKIATPQEIALAKASKL